MKFRKGQGKKTGDAIKEWGMMCNPPNFQLVTNHGSTSSSTVVQQPVAESVEAHQPAVPEPADGQGPVGTES
ncbi:hypothetical protein [uncultured Fibrobacter sp.]|uniref:hypothetical protein n=1 Tax=uncultured Fibrobacter sp. TaxID=261512 RepID=UPI002596D029|nr:hypothetical protein [uncultured Fibrobacter sp.]